MQRTRTDDVSWKNGPHFVRLLGTPMVFPFAGFFQKLWRPHSRRRKGKTRYNYKLQPSFSSDQKMINYDASSRSRPPWPFFFLPPFFLGIEDATPAILISIVLFALPGDTNFLKLRPSAEPLITWKAVERRVPWGIILLLGGGFALGKGCKKSGMWHKKRGCSQKHFDGLVLRRGAYYQHFWVMDCIGRIAFFKAWMIGLGNNWPASRIWIPSSSNW